MGYTGAMWSAHFLLVVLIELILLGKGKGKFHSRTDHDCPEGKSMYSSTLSLTSALDGVGG